MMRQTESKLKTIDSELAALLEELHRVTVRLSKICEEKETLNTIIRAVEDKIAEDIDTAP